MGGITAPTQTLRSSTLLDGKVWNGVDPKGTPPVSPFNMKGHEMKPANTQPRAQTQPPGESLSVAAAGAKLRRPLNARACSVAAGLALLLLGWQLAAIGERLPDAVESTLDSALTPFSDPSTATDRTI